MTDTLALLRQQNTRQVTLRLNGETVHSVPPGTPDTLTFTLARVPAREVRSNLLYAALGRDGYVAYANWYNAQAQQARAQAEAATRKQGDPEPFDDTPPDDATWRAHTVALEEAVDAAVLEVGLIDPPYRDAAPVLGPYRAALVREIVTWGREAPSWVPPTPLPGDATPGQRAAAEENDAAGKSWNGSAEPP